MARREGAKPPSIRRSNKTLAQQWGGQALRALQNPEARWFGPKGRSSAFTIIPDDVKVGWARTALHFAIKHRERYPRRAA